MVLEKTPESPFNSKEIKPVNLKGREINPEYSVEGLMLKLQLQYFGHLMRTDNSLEKSLMLAKIKCRRRRGCQRMRWHHRCNEHELGQTPGGGEGQGSLAFCSPRGCDE